MIRYSCDICGKELARLFNEATYTNRFRSKAKQNRMPVVLVRALQLDMCEKCARSIAATWQGVKKRVP